MVLEISGKNAGLLPLEIVDDVTVGRGVGEGAPSLDLTVLEAFENGVSRQHALLRPSRGNLYLLDLESSNGTYVNGIRLGRGVAHALSVQDAISLGKLKFTVYALERHGIDESKMMTAQMQRPLELGDVSLAAMLKASRESEGESPESDETKPMADKPAGTDQEISTKPFPQQKESASPDKAPASVDGNIGPDQGPPERDTQQEVLTALDAIEMESSEQANKYQSEGSLPAGSHGDDEPEAGKKK
jgi:predicted component of type VI protein secretion system